MESGSRRRRRDSNRPILNGFFFLCIFQFFVLSLVLGLTNLSSDLPPETGLRIFLWTESCLAVTCSMFFYSINESNKFMQLILTSSQNVASSFTWMCMTPTCCMYYGRTLCASWMSVCVCVVRFHSIWIRFKLWMGTYVVRTMTWCMCVCLNVSECISRGASLVNSSGRLSRVIRK